MKSIHPLTAFVLIMLITIEAALFGEPVTVLTALITGAVFGVMIGIRRFGIYIAVAVVSAVAVPVFSHRGETILFFVNDSPITMEAVLCGLNMGAMLAAVMLWFAAYNRIMDVEKNLYLFSCITPRLGAMISMALRFSPLFAKTFGRISTAQKTMGMYSRPSLVERVHSRLTAFDATVTRVLESGVNTAASMDARGYGRGRRTGYSLFRFGRRDGILLGAAITAGLIPLLFKSGLKFSFYPVITPIYTDPLPRAAYAILCFLPIGVEAAEKIRWKYLTLKISNSHMRAPLPRL